MKEVNYNYTGAKVLVKAHKITEEKLHQDATKMMHSLKMASTDAHLLHEKVKRQSEVAETNQNVIEKMMGKLKGNKITTIFMISIRLSLSLSLITS